MRFRIPRSNELDFLRLILATSVVFQHSHLAGINTHMSWIERIPAVPLFILLSGLLVTESYSNSPSLVIYIQKRIRRIVPAYFAVVLLGGVLLWSVGVIYPVSGSGSIWQLISYYFYNIIFLNFLHPCVFDSSAFDEIKYCAVNGSLWTIKFELLFYLLLPLVLLVVTRISKIICFIVSLLLLFSTVFSPSIYITISICFVAGVLLSVSKDYWLPGLAKWKIPSIVRVVIVFLVAILMGGNLPIPLTAITLLSASFIGTQNPSRDLNFVRFGDLSYGIYLVHYPLIQVARFTGFSTLVPDYLFAPLLTILSGVLAALLYKYVESRYLLSGSHYKAIVR